MVQTEIVSADWIAVLLLQRLHVALKNDIDLLASSMSEDFLKNHRPIPQTNFWTYLKNAVLIGGKC